MLLPSVLSDTTQSRLEQLIADQESEGPHLEFKRDLPSSWDRESKNEFLADVTSFANAGGGDLVYGLNEDGNGLAYSLVPQTLPDTSDKFQIKLYQILRENIEPRLPGIQIHIVAVDVGNVAGHAVIIRIPQSWAGPHRLLTNRSFHVR